MKLTHPLAPVIVAIVAIALLSVMDGAMKGASLALGAYSAMLWRALMSSAITMPLWLGARTPWPKPAVMRVHLFRGVIVAVMALLFFHSLTLLPLAQAIAISFFAPLISLYLAAVMLGEKIAPSAILASLIGLAGVAVICWPELTVERTPKRIEGIAAVLASAVLYALNLVFARRQALIAKPREIAFFQNAIGGAVLICFAPWFLRSPSGALTWVAVSSLLSIGAALLLAWAYARAEAQVLVPMEYSAFGWAAAVGWLAFHEPVSTTTLAGVALIVAACLVAARGTPPEPVAA
ncbi:DMT family transporter [Novosphingobium sp. Gsoil 351]|uniref:DMT family transporter n=1 Tax=Novosphingobium sp. Gsoil 351 TaxID=2675225 RepID=UPI0012B4D121|nr:DMT family transporter [Novosphingobium sp. Gsoil 351]QGN55149.1 EamA family transporter [Novosphingobium sp. Gsoil 351]